MTMPSRYAMRSEANPGHQAHLQFWRSRISKTPVNMAEIWPTRLWTYSPLSGYNTTKSPGRYVFGCFHSTQGRFQGLALLACSKPCRFSTLRGPLLHIVKHAYGCCARLPLAAASQPGKVRVAYQQINCLQPIYFTLNFKINWDIYKFNLVMSGNRLGDNVIWQRTSTASRFVAAGKI